MRPIILERAKPISINYSVLIDVWVEMICLTFVLRSLKKRCYGNHLIEIHCLQSLLWRSKTECNSATCIRALRPPIMQLRVKIW